MIWVFVLLTLRVPTTLSQGYDLQPPSNSYGAADEVFGRPSGQSDYDYDSVDTDYYDSNYSEGDSSDTVVDSPATTYGAPQDGAGDDNSRDRLDSGNGFTNEGFDEVNARIGEPVVPILVDERVGPLEDGTYSFNFETGDGITRAERGYPQGEDGAITQEGSFSFTFPDGTPAEFTFIADENGFRIESPLIPTPPPMPEHALRQIEKARQEDEDAASMGRLGSEDDSTNSGFADEFGGRSSNRNNNQGLQAPNQSYGAPDSFDDQPQVPDQSYSAPQSDDIGPSSDFGSSRGSPTNGVRADTSRFAGNSNQEKRPSNSPSRSYSAPGEESQTQSSSGSLQSQSRNNLNNRGPSRRRNSENSRQNPSDSYSAPSNTVSTSRRPSQGRLGNILSNSPNNRKQPPSQSYTAPIGPSQVTGRTSNQGSSVKSNNLPRLPNRRNENLSQTYEAPTTRSQSLGRIDERRNQSPNTLSRSSNRVNEKPSQTYGTPNRRNQGPGRNNPRRKQRPQSPNQSNTGQRRRTGPRSGNRQNMRNPQTPSSSYSTTSSGSRAQANRSNRRPGTPNQPRNNNNRVLNKYGSKVSGVSNNNRVNNPNQSYGVPNTRASQSINFRSESSNSFDGSSNTIEEPSQAYGAPESGEYSR